ncbi:MAG: L-glutamate gamma-semialdehyde dehydrogenase, partial [Proteobacteria bacterium]
MFKNEPLTDFTVADNRERFANALDRLESRLKIAPLKAGSIINGEHILSGEKCEREDPSTPSVIVGNTYFADAASVQKALAVVQAGQPAWKMTPAEKRAGILKQTAHIMRERKFDLA